MTTNEAKDTMYSLLDSNVLLLNALKLVNKLQDVPRTEYNNKISGMINEQIAQAVDLLEKSSILVKGDSNED